MESIFNYEGTGAGESLTVSEISTRVHRKISNVTPVVDFLEERGIAERVSMKRTAG